MSDPTEKQISGRCLVCGKPAEASICSPCQDRIRAEAAGRKIAVERGGRTDRERGVRKGPPPATLPDNDEL